MERVEAVYVFLKIQAY